jgi:hypothetical protein
VYCAGVIWSRSYRSVHCCISFFKIITAVADYFYNDWSQQFLKNQKSKLEFRNCEISDWKFGVFDMVLHRSALNHRIRNWNPFADIWIWSRIIIKNIKWIFKIKNCCCSELNVICFCIGSLLVSVETSALIKRPWMGYRLCYD